MVNKDEEGRVKDLSAWLGCLRRTNGAVERVVDRRMEAPELLRREIQFIVLGGAGPE